MTAPRREPVFISLTTIRARLPVLDQVLETLLRQSLRADRIMLNISIDPYALDAGIRFEQLPVRTREWAVAGKIEIYFGRNIGPYRKIMPTLQRFSGIDYFVATADDDVLYPEDWLEGLVAAARSHGCVAAYRCRLMEHHGAALTRYNSWSFPVTEDDFRAHGLDRATPSLRLFPNGRDGVIYHSRHLKDFQNAVPAPAVSTAQRRHPSEVYHLAGWRSGHPGAAGRRRRGRSGLSSRRHQRPDAVGEERAGRQRRGFGPRAHMVPGASRSEPGGMSRVIVVVPP